ncbi:MAG: hypothetical protein CL420_07585 [Acidimicrobiaceae bacterium]|nr:hypothetical protein [Acidimicrobiaceae bacterium]
MIALALLQRVIRPGIIINLTLLLIEELHHLLQALEAGQYKFIKATIGKTVIMVLTQTLTTLVSSCEESRNRTMAQLLEHIIGIQVKL